MTDERALYLELKGDLLRCGHEQIFKGRGLSMFPNLLPGFAYRVKYAPIGRLQAGDVVVIRGEDGVFMAHRFVRRDGHMLITKGDACSVEDTPHRPAAYLGRVEDRVLGPLRVRRSFIEPLMSLAFGRPDPPLCVSGARWTVDLVRRLRKMRR